MSGLAPADGGRLSADEGGVGSGSAANGWPPLLPPWVSVPAWTEVTTALDHHLSLPHIQDHVSLWGKAKTVADLITRLESPMTALARETCVDCADPCCVKATLWYDGIDLLVMGLTRSPWPEGQPMVARGAVCRYLGPTGCRLPRHRRPWICTWYRCPRQTKCLDPDEAARRRIDHCLSAIKRIRKAVERDFITAVWGPR